MYYAFGATIAETLEVLKSCRKKLTSIISGMAQVLATTPLDPEQRELVSAMVFSADVLLAIISDVLDLSKVEAGMLIFYIRETVFFLFLSSSKVI